MYWQKLQRVSQYINLTVTNAILNKRGKEKKGGEEESGRTERAKGQKAEQRQPSEGRRMMKAELLQLC